MSQQLIIAALLLLFVMVLILMVLVLSLARQIGVLYERIAPAGALAINRQLQVGDSAKAMTLQSLDQKTVQIAGTGKAQLLFFLSPQCPVCKQLLKPLKSVAQAEKDWLEVILASDGASLASHQDFVVSAQLQAFPYVLSEALGKSYGVSKLPYAVLIDKTGKIAAFGIINSREHLESLFEAQQRGVGDIQTWFNHSRHQEQSNEMAR